LGTWLGIIIMNVDERSCNGASFLCVLLTRKNPLRFHLLAV